MLMTSSLPSHKTVLVTHCVLNDVAIWLERSFPGEVEGYMEDALHLETNW